uniref:hypothetical protein n=1 Tax=Rhodococcus rhodochrous TaxID=1829 RepID=UPI001E2C2FE5
DILKLGDFERNYACRKNGPNWRKVDPQINGEARAAGIKQVQMTHSIMTNLNRGEEGNNG